MVSPADQFIITEFISLGICDFLDSIISSCKIKWPNDIYAGDDKIAGILIENSITGNALTCSVAGIGLNINQDAFPEEIPNPVSLRMITGREHDIRLCLVSLLQCLDKRYKKVITDERDQLRNDYISRLYRLNRWHDFSAGGRIFSGRIISVGETGCLNIEDGDGRTREFAFREIDFII